MSLATRVAGVGYTLLGVGFGGGAAWAIAHLRRTGELPMTPFGFRALSGPFEKLGAGWFSILGGALIATCSLHIISGAWLWRGERRGLTLAVAATPVSFALALGFALPFLLLGLPVSLALAVAGRRSLRD